MATFALFDSLRKGGGRDLLWVVADSPQSPVRKFLPPEGDPQGTDGWAYRYVLEATGKAADGFVSTPLGLARLLGMFTALREVEGREG